MSFDFDLPHAEGPLANGAGVQPWSNPEQYVIFSIETGAQLASPARVKGLEDWLAFHDIGFKRLQGCYKDKLEPAWIINTRDWRAIAQSDWIGGQESVLHLGPWEAGNASRFAGRAATLYYQRKGAPGVERWQESIGVFHLTGKAYALKQEAWTFDPSTGEYYVCG